MCSYQYFDVTNKNKFKRKQRSSKRKQKYCNRCRSHTAESFSIENCIKLTIHAPQTMQTFVYLSQLDGLTWRVYQCMQCTNIIPISYRLLVDVIRIYTLLFVDVFVNKIIKIKIRLHAQLAIGNANKE